MPRRALFCPTEYCSSRAVPSVGKSAYLRTLGAELDPRIQILWTGPDVVSPEVSAENIAEVRAVLGRKPLLWDNIHANDYDAGIRVFMGAYDGRTTSMRHVAAGVLTNPNCEFYANFVPLHTLGSFLRLGSGYSAEQALSAALHDWVYVLHGRPTKQTGTPPVLPLLRVAEEDLRALVDFFSLPWRHGQLALSFADAVMRLTRAEPEARAELLATCRTALALVCRLQRALPRPTAADLRPYLEQLGHLATLCEAVAHDTGTDAGSQGAVPTGDLSAVVCRLAPFDCAARALLSQCALDNFRSTLSFEQDRSNGFAT